MRKGEAMKNTARADESGVAPKVLVRGAKVGQRYDLRTLRVALGLTQAEIAERSGMAQGDVSRLEGQEDLRLSTLARHAEALGGKLDVAVVIDGRRYTLAL
jgi:DNA-binding Xre family transcriptional regulator